MSTTKQILHSVADQDAYAKQVCDLIKSIACSYYQLPITAYASKSRKRQVIKMKQSSVYFMRLLLPKATLNYIGKEMDYDHATVLHCIKNIKNLLETDKETQSDIQSLQQRIDIKNELSSLNDSAENEFHYINLDKCVSFKLSDGRGIVLSGWSQEQINTFIESVRSLDKIELKKHKHSNTGLFILEKNPTKDK